MAKYLRDLPIGSLVKFGRYSVNGEPAQSIAWRIVAKSDYGGPVTLLTDEVIDYRPMDADEAANTDSQRRIVGSNHYVVSNLDQWLNSSAAPGEWFSPRTDTDVAPNSGTTQCDAPYADKEGFLHFFHEWERNALSSKTLPCQYPDIDGGRINNYTRKVFLPSMAEVGVPSDYSEADGTLWEYFATASPLAYLTKQARDNSTAWGNILPGINDTAEYWTRSPKKGSTCSMQVVRQVTGGSYGDCHVPKGVRPACTLKDTTFVTDVVDDDGCYITYENQAPSAPTNLYWKIGDVWKAGSATAGQQIYLTWGKSTDPEGTSCSYRVEYRIGESGTWLTKVNVSSGVSTYVTAPSSGPVYYRVIALDVQRVESAPLEMSVGITIVQNNAPIISGEDADIGVVDNGVSIGYNITDADGNVVTVTESLDGVTLRTYEATLGEDVTLAVAGEPWLKLTNGAHTVTISANDGYETATRTYTFTKSVTSCSVETSAMTMGTMPTVIFTMVTKSHPEGAIFTIEACNNGNDASPTWEDIAPAVAEGEAYAFTNTTKTADSWAVKIRAKLDRNGTVGACYISEIGGNFQ